MTLGSTFLLKRRNQMPQKSFDKCHDGVGSLDFVGVLGGNDVKGRRMNFIHDDILPPGVSIGVHPHTNEEEYYYVISGSGTMILDGQRFDVAAGDIAAVFPSGSHGLENTGGADLRIIVINVSA